MKRTICTMLAAAMLAVAFAGCAKPAEQSKFEADNEIFTYEKIDPEKTQIVVSSLGNNANVKKLSGAFVALNPDVQVICIDITGGTEAYKPVEDWVKNGAAPDVMFVNYDSFVNKDFIAQHFENLSASPVIGNFEAASLDNVAVNGFIYFLPAPSEINCIIYNKTLFEQHGWKAPATFDEFIALCVQIREETGGEVQPWNPNAKYDKVFSTALEAFTYAELFGGADNRGWYNDFCEGKAAFSGHMEPFYEMIQALIDNGVLCEEHFNYSATTHGKEFAAGKIAMYNAPISRLDSSEYTFDYMPYPSTNGDVGFVSNYFSSMLGVPIKEHTEAQRDAIDRFVAFFATKEGQVALIGDTMMVSNVKGVPLNQSETMASIADVIALGHMFGLVDFTGNGKRTWSFRENALSMLTGEKTGAQIIAEIDEKPYDTASVSAAAVKIADVDANFTTLEFSCYIADMYREKANADIGLITHGVPYRGNLVRLFAGDIYDSYMYPIKPRSFANDSTLVKLSMTGRQIMDALNNPVGNDKTANCIYAFSGLVCEVAPWNELGSKYVSVKQNNHHTMAFMPRRK